MNALSQQNKQHPYPYSLSVRDAAVHFGFAAQTLYDWISIGKLHRGTHYLKVGKKIVIVRRAFIQFLQQEDGSNGGKNAE